MHNAGEHTSPKPEKCLGSPFIPVMRNDASLKIQNSVVVFFHVYVIALRIFSNWMVLALD
jgi:hypothetical protein